MSATVPPDWRHRAALRPSVVAAVSGLSLRSVRRRIADGSLASRKVGNARLVPVGAVLELVGEAEPTPAALERSELVRRRADEIEAVLAER